MRVKCQAISEYVIVFVALIAAFLAMKAYVSRGYSGYLKKYSDGFSGGQFSSKYSNYDEIKEVVPFNTSMRKGLSVSGKENNASYSQNIDLQLSRTVGGKVAVLDMEAQEINAASETEAALKQLDAYKGKTLSSFNAFVNNKELEKMPGDYQVTDRAGNLDQRDTVVDNFSNEKLANDTIY